MKEYNFKPEGWDFNTNTINKVDLYNVMDCKETLQGIVEKCDENYNLYVKFGNSIKWWKRNQGEI